jgi:gliding motility-associated-like protein
MNKRSTGYYLSLLTILVFFLILSFSPGTSFSQSYLKAEVRGTNCPIADHEADRWYFGQNAGLDFRGQDPIADLTNYLLNVPTSAAVMSDSNGVVILYSDGIRVYNRMGQIVANGDGLHGFVGYTMPVLIVPNPEIDSIYYVFTTHRPKQNANDPQTVYGLEYNEVRLDRNGGAGAVTIKNKVLLQPEVSSKLTAVKQSNGVDYWVVAHKFNSNEFCSFAVTKNGVDTNNYVSSSIGTVQAAPGETNNGIGYMKISPDGTKLALAIHGTDVYEIYNFDASNGKVTNVITSPTTFDEAYGIEFSPDSRYFYGTTTSTSLPQPNYTPPSYLFQFDITKGNAIFSVGNYDTIASDTLGSYYGGIQLGTDGRIYVSRSPYGNAALSVIQNPKRPGAACNFTVNALDLQGKKSRFGFPNFVQSYFDLPHFDVENVCFTDATNFILQDNSNVDDASWQFVDGSQVTLTGVQPTYTFTGPGSYDVTVRETFNGITYGPYTETVVIQSLPQTNLDDTVYMYPGSPIRLDAGSGYVSYEWSTGANTQIIDIGQPGIYTVTIENDLCCFKSDTVEVLYFDVMLPNAFRPGGSNPLFKAYASSLDAIRNFNMYIYNRWGQQIYATKDINLGWDGTIDGKEAPGDVYVWLVTYDIERKGKTETVANKGNVILLR